MEASGLREKGLEELCLVLAADKEWKWAIRGKVSGILDCKHSFHEPEAFDFSLVRAAKSCCLPG